MATTNISEEEAQLYDRQIRLWGLDAQKRLRSSRVLISGLGGLGCEVAKNIVLAGIKSLRLMDTATASERGANFMVAAKGDENRAAGSLEKIRLLNPMVEVTSSEKNILQEVEDNQDFLKVQ